MERRVIDLMAALLGGRRRPMHACVLTILATIMPTKQVLSIK
jgi:hypothetical protein